jgi:amino acid transporter
VGEDSGQLHRHFGTWQATALNVTMIVGAGVFITIPYMLLELPGPYALLGWLAAGALILVDGLIWSELGAALPGSGGSYHYLLESYGRQRWGRLMAFLFIWQFMLSGPLELASGLIAMDAFAQSLSPDLAAFNQAHRLHLVLWEKHALALTLSPVRAGCVAVGAVIILLLYRRATTLARLTMAMGLGVLAVIVWMLVEGWANFDMTRALDFSGAAATPPDIARQLGVAMSLALYSYLGYYNICYVGDEVREPGRTIPRAVLYSAALVVVLFVGLHLAMLGTVSWRAVPASADKLDGYSLPAEFMRRTRGEWAAQLITVLLMGSCFAAAFAGLLGYSRIPYGAARHGHFYRAIAAVHPKLCIPHVSLVLVGGMMLLWSFFDLENVIKALITTRILEQFVAQIIGVALLRRNRPDLPRPFRLWFYPLPCGLALAGWLYVYFTSAPLYIVLGLATLLTGVVAFGVWSWRFPSPPQPPSPKEGEGAGTSGSPSPVSCSPSPALGEGVGG